MNLGRQVVNSVRTATYASHRPCKRRWSYARCYSAGEPSDRHIKETATVDTNPNSIFSSHGDSAWDRVFENLDDYKAQTSPSRRETTARPGKSIQRQEGHRRQAMTASEMNAFDEIFNMIFDAADRHESGSSPAQQESSKVNAVGNMVTSLRLRSRGSRLATEQDERLDRKKEEIDLCATDVELLHWAQREVLDAFDGGPEPQAASNFTETAEEGIVQSSDGRPSSSSSGALHTRTYSHLIAYLMRTFRDKYKDPYLALALFDKVRHRSLASYVFGCSTQVYNELIETMWVCFRDLRGVHNALEEMVVNGVIVDARTAKLVEMVRRQVGERNVWAENLDHRNGEIWHLLLRLDHLIAKSTSPKKKKAPEWDQWKKELLKDKDENNWEFGQWSRTAQG